MLLQKSAVTYLAAAIIHEIVFISYLSSSSSSFLFLSLSHCACVQACVRACVHVLRAGCGIRFLLLTQLKGRWLFPVSEFGWTKNTFRCHQCLFHFYPPCAQWNQNLAALWTFKVIYPHTARLLLTPASKQPPIGKIKWSHIYLLSCTGFTRLPLACLLGGILKSLQYAVISVALLEFIKETIGSCCLLHKRTSWAEVFKAASRCKSPCRLENRTVFSRCHVDICKIWII